MNSDDVIRRLHRLTNDQQIPHRARNEIAHAINHIRLQDTEIAELREDITDVSIPDDGLLSDQIPDPFYNAEDED